MVEDALLLLNLLRKRPDQVTPLEWIELYRLLGNLAPLVLHDEAVRRIEKEVRIRFPMVQLPQDRGSCWIVMATVHPEDYPLLRPAFVIPLQWLKTEQGDPRLPARLHELSQRVRTELAIAFGEPEYREWNLHLHPYFAPPDATLSFRSLDDRLSFESGWVALAGGLYLAQHNGQPDEHVWVSARWCPQRGIQRVGHLEEKLALAAQFQVRSFFIPDEQENEVPQCYLPMICKLPQGSNRLRDVLATYLSALDVRPAQPACDEASFRHCAAWYMRQLRPLEHCHFYCHYLLPYLAEKLRQQFRQEHPLYQPEVLVTVVSPSWNLVPLMARVFGVRQCALLYTSDDARIAAHVAEVRNYLQQCTQVEQMMEIPFRMNQMAEDFLRLPVWQVYPADKVLVDLTPGKKLMSLHLYSAAPRGSWMVYLDSHQQEGRPVLGTERLVCWQRS
ncbi:MAG: hypothetical protein RMI91_02705 [Gemmatales bacterium]|nr:hypothetical protein [Gemmatales bacterium]MDW7993538.1 hypothetical protein [Gemmatales bacterium]